MEKLIESIYKKAGVELNESTDESLNETYEDEDFMFEDPQGIFGIPHGEYKFSELRYIYDDLKENDPSMRDYTSFEDWWKDTRGYLNRIIPIEV